MISDYYYGCIREFGVYNKLYFNCGLPSKKAGNMLCSNIHIYIYNYMNIATYIHVAVHTYIHIIYIYIIYVYIAVLPTNYIGCDCTLYLQYIVMCIDADRLFSSSCSLPSE